MGKTIWKFALRSESRIGMPEGAQVLGVHEQDGGVCLWALVDPKAPMVSRRFLAFGTGHPIPGDTPLSFLGTVFLDGGGLVFHLFEAVEG